MERAQTTTELDSEEIRLVAEASKKRVPFMLYPEDQLKNIWDLIISLVLVYISISLPYELCYELFEETKIPSHQQDVWYNIGRVLNEVWNWMFFVDIVIICFSAVPTAQGTLITNRRKIFMMYLKTWMVLDIVAIFPVDFLVSFIQVPQEGEEQQSSQFSLYSKAAKLLRLSRVIKIFKLVRFFKLLSQDSALKKYLSKMLSVTVAVERLVYSGLVFCMIVHMLCCGWICVANYSYTMDGTSWVWENDLQGLTRWELYITAVYYTITTMTTVGYGDISAVDTNERVLAVVTMLVGVVTFSYATGSLSSILASVDTTSAQILMRKQVLEQIRDQYKISPHLYAECLEYISFAAATSSTEYRELLNELPHKLRVRIGKRLYKQLKNQIYLFNKIRDQNFITWILPLLSPLMVLEDQQLQVENDPLTHVSFIQKGKAAYVLPRFQFYEFCDINNGEQFGMLDIMFRSKELQLEKLMDDKHKASTLSTFVELTLSAEIPCKFNINAREYTVMQ